MALRFATLLVAAAAISATIGETVWYHVYTDTADAVISRCREAAELDSSAGSRAYSMCTRSMEHGRVLWTVWWAAAVIGGAVVLGGVGCVVRRRRTELLPVDRLPAVAAAQAAIESAIGVAYPLRWRRGIAIASARADGIVRPYIEVGPRLAALAGSDRGAFDAVLRHEIAHHQTHDIAASRWTYWSLWALVPAVGALLLALWDEGWDTGILPLIRVCAGLLVIALARASALRSREFAADLRATSGGASSDDMGKILRSGHGPRRRKASMLRPFAHHPVPELRAEIVRRPALLDRLAPIDGFIVGATATIAAPVITRLVRGWTQFGDPAFYAEWIAWGVVGALVGGWLGAVVAAATSAERRGGTQVRLAPFGLAVGAGFLAGEWLFSQSLQLGVRALPRTGLGAVAFVVIPIVTVALVGWLRSLASLGPADRRMPLIVTVAGIAITSLVLGQLGSFTANGHLAATPGGQYATETSPNQPLDILRFIWLTLSPRGSLMLAAFAVIAPLLVAWRSWRRRGWRGRGSLLVVAAVAAAAVAAGISFAIADQVVDVAGRADGNWFSLSMAVAGLQTLTALPIILVALVLSGGSGHGHVVRATAIAAAATPLAAAAVVLVQRLGSSADPSLDVWFQIAADLAALAVGATALVGTAIAIASPRDGGHRAARHRIAVAGTVAAVAIFGGVAIGARGVRASEAAERAHLDHQLLPVMADTPRLVVCGAGVPIERADRRWLGELVDDLSLAGARPGRAAYVEAHATLVDTLTGCRNSLAEALERGEVLVSEEAALGFLIGLCQFVEIGAPLQLEYARFLDELGLCV